MKKLQPILMPTNCADAKIFVKMNRRWFLASMGALAFSPIISGCNSQEQKNLLIRLLKNAVPPQFVNEFSKRINSAPNLDFTSVAQLKDLFDQLQQGQQESALGGKPKSKLPFPIPLISSPIVTIPDLVMLGDYWLSLAIKQGLIQPLDVKQLSLWSTLPSRWQNFVKRNEQGELDPHGQIWAAPYRWGTTAIAYHREKFKSLGWTPTDWSDLWRSELRDRISLLDSPREVIGLTLKKLGYSYNTQELGKIPHLKQELSQLHKQVKLYSSTAYLEPLILGDTWLAVGWSTDILHQMETMSDAIGAIIPQSGTALWSELWVQPTNINPDHSSKLNSFAQAWIDFCWQPDIAAKISLLTQGTSPVLTDITQADLPTEIKQNKLLFPSPEIFQHSEFLEPLSTPAINQYRSLWEEIRS